MTSAFRALALALALLFATGFAAAPRAQIPPGPPAGVRSVGGGVAPRSFTFSSLPRHVGGPPAEVREGHPEGVWEQAEADLERLKLNPQGPSMSELAHVTLDRGGPGAFGVRPGAQPAAPVAGNGFEGITQGPFIPSEPTVAAGPLNLFSAGNVTVTVTNRDGTNRVETDGLTFFGAPSSEGAISDAQCCFDAPRGRFVAVAFTQGTSSGGFSYFYLAISQTNDARGAWWLYKLDMKKDGSVTTSNWSDYESVGLSDDKLVLTAQQFTFGGNSYQYQKIRVLDRAAAYAGGTLAWVDIVNFAPPPGGDSYDDFVTKAARNLGAGDSTIHLFNVRTNGGSNVTYRELTGPPASPRLTLATRVGCSSYSAPPDAAQKGTTGLVATNDCRPGDFYVRGGVLVVAWHTAASFGGGQVCAVRLFELRTSDQTVLDDETFGQNGVFDYYPAATVDSAGSVYLGFDRSSSTEYPSSYVTGRRRSDATLEPSLLIKAGLSSTSQSRWGDFTGIDTDEPASGPSGSVAWYAGQWTKATNTFGTWINRVSFSYGQIAGTVVDDCDGQTGTSGDRAPLQGGTVTLQSGSTLLGSATTDAAGAFSFGWLEAGTYDVVVTPPPGGAAVDAVAGSGGTSQLRVGATDVQVALTTTQVSSGNQFLVQSAHPQPSLAAISPSTKNPGDPGFTLTVDGAAFTACSTVRVDGADRPTTRVGPTRLQATIPASDVAASGPRQITVFTPAPAGGVSAPLPLTVTDPVPPVIAVTSPAGGETWKAGSHHAITWTASDNVGVTAVDLALSADGGGTWTLPVASGLGNAGTYAWTVPDTVGGAFRVRATARDAAGNAASDSSHANFTLERWIVNAAAGPGGTITPSGAVAVREGATLAFTIAPSAGFHVVDVSVDGASEGPLTAWSFPAVSAAHTITAAFSADSFALTTGVSGAGSVARSPDQPLYAAGSSVTLTAVPGAGWAFQAWSGDTAATSNPLVVVMRANRAATAAFADTAAPAVTVVGPNGGESLTEGAVAQLAWTATDNVGVTAVDLFLSRSGPAGPFDTLAAGLANGGAYAWTVTGPGTSDAWLRAAAHDAAGNVGGDLSDGAFTIVATAGADDAPVRDFALSPVRPNPFHAAATFGFALPRAALVRLAILDVQGREVVTLADGSYGAGRHAVAWTNGTRGGLGPGLYFARLRVAGRTFTRRFVVEN